MEAGTAAAHEGGGRRPPRRPGATAWLEASGPATPLRVAAAVLVAVTVAALQVRLDWDAGFFLLISLVGSAIVVPWALQAADGLERPRAATSGRAERPSGDSAATSVADAGHPSGAVTAMLVAGLVLVALTIGNLADALGAEGGPGSTTWTALLFAAIAAFAGWRLNSPVCALLSSVALGVAFIAAVDWIFDPNGIGTFRWLFLILALAYGAAAFALERTRHRHAVQHVSAAGLALLVLAATLYFDVLGQAVASFGASEPSGISANAPFGWELVVLVGSAALIAYAVLRREPGPGYIGAILLLVSTVIASAPESKISIVGWPLLLLVLALAAVAAVVATERGAGTGPARPADRRPDEGL